MKRFVLFVGLISVLTSIHTGRALGQDANAPPTLDAKLRVKVGAKLEISCRFLLPGKADQTFANIEYRYAVLDKDGNQVDGALALKTVVRSISLPKGMRSVADGTDASIVASKLKSGEEYYFVVSVRNLTALAKFRAP
ncbi:MAG TPA: hypothetical protein ENJ16_00410 [Planctomycetaceae bacterium]|nr:hypothetical protein [Planctomycetaceae bacterium]